MDFGNDIPFGAAPVNFCKNQLVSGLLVIKLLGYYPIFTL